MTCQLVLVIKLIIKNYAIIIYIQITNRQIISWSLLQQSVMQKQQLSQILHESDLMTQELTTLRAALINGQVNSTYAVSTDLFLQAIKQRTMLRTLADTLQTNRNLAQIDKQKIEKSRIVLEGLEFFKKTLKDKIQGYHTEVESIDEYLEEPIGHIDWEKDYESGESKLKASLQKLRQKDQQYRKKISQKQQIIKQMNEKSKLYSSVLPKQVKKLRDEVTQTAKLFQIQANETLHKIQSQKLANIYDSFKTLKRIQKVEITYSKQQHEVLDLILKPKKLVLYDQALQFNLKLQQKQIKIKISDLRPEIYRLVIGVDRRCDFTSRDLFHRLINFQEVKSIFEQASNQSQRNINNKYTHLKWLEDVLCMSIEKCSKFLKLVRERAFAVLLIKHIFDTLKNPSWLNSVSSTAASEFTNKKLIIESVQKINFNQYKQQTYIPPSVRKSVNSYEEYLRIQTISKPTQLEQQKHKKNKANLEQLLGIICLTEMIVPDLNMYYKVVIVYRTFRVTCVIIIPFEYPDVSNHKPCIKILNLEALQDPNTEPSLPVSLECKAKLSTASTTKMEISQILQKIEHSSRYQPQAGFNEAFGIVRYIGKFMDSIIRHQGEHAERKATGNK